jgi:formamidopyrimidine-DNA glycosylase
VPELPEVETMVRKFRRKVCGRTVRGFSATWPRQIQPSVARVRRSLRGRTIVRMGRRGKHMIFHLDDGSCLMVHLGMSGRLEWAGDHAVPPPHVRAEFQLSGAGRLLFCDARKFGRIRYADDLREACRHLGIEPLSRRFTVDALDRALEARSRQIKPLLLDQSVVAGLGNIYVDESLHRAGIHPLTPASRLTRAEVRRLHRAIGRVLREAIRRCGTSFDWVYPGGRMQHDLRVYGRGGEACRKCGTPIRRILVGQRSTHFCPACQRRRRGS